VKSIWTGTLKKMRVEATEPVDYFVRDGWHDPAQRGPELPLNTLLDRSLTLRYLGEVNCVYCGRATKKAFGQGFCFPCFRARAEADICIVKPELCHYHKADDPCRDEQFAQSQCFQPHYLYCSLTSGVKVGITRAPNIPSRWIDQGATAAIPLAVLPNRREVGLVEKRLVDAGFADKTHWTRMLKGEVDATDLPKRAADTVRALAAWGITGLLSEPERILHTFTYPVLTYPSKVKSLNLDREAEVGGRLVGIKGQYLIFDSGVINLRKYTGYRVELLA
jgi:hypothetical protein